MFAKKKERKEKRERDLKKRGTNKRVIMERTNEQVEHFTC